MLSTAELSEAIRRIDEHFRALCGVLMEADKIGKLYNRDAVKSHVYSITTELLGAGCVPEVK